GQQDLTGRQDQTSQQDLTGRQDLTGQQLAEAVRQAHAHAQVAQEQVLAAETILAKYLTAQTVADHPHWYQYLVGQITNLLHHHHTLDPQAQTDQPIQADVWAKAEDLAHTLAAATPLAQAVTALTPPAQLVTTPTTPTAKPGSQQPPDQWLTRLANIALSGFGHNRLTGGPTN